MSGPSLAKYRLPLAVLICAALYAVSLASKPLRSAFPATSATLEGKFTRDGQYPSEPLMGVVNVRTWGSWSGDDINQGRLKFGPFPAPAQLRFGIGGYPTQPGNQVHLERVDTAERVRIPVLVDVGERWRIMAFEVPAGWIGKPVNLIATDAETGLGGWLSITEPMQGLWGGDYTAFVQMLAAWSITGLLLSFLYVGTARWLTRRAWVAPHWVPLVAGAFIAGCGYVAFWVYFAAAVAGKIFSVAVLAGGMLAAWRERRMTGQEEPDLKAVPELMLIIGFFYLALLYLFPSTLDTYALAANRFTVGLPGDNTLPHNVAWNLYHGKPLRVAGVDWLSSDRPPLQSGWQLVTWPVMQGLRFEEHIASDTASVWFQLLWVPAVFGLLRTLGLEQRRVSAWIAVLALSGFFLLNTVFTWPKLSAGAFACGAFALWVLPRANGRSLLAGDVIDSDAPESPARRLLQRGETGLASPSVIRPVLLGAALAALAWLSHGGVAFSFLALVPWLLWRCCRGEWRRWTLAAAVFAVFALPWLAYQKFYDPPGNRLLKWHLAGQIDKDVRGTWRTIRDSYAKTPARVVWQNKLANLAVQVRGDWRTLFDGRAAGAGARRNEEFYNLLRALSWWGAGLVLLPVMLARGKKPFHAGVHAALAGWIVLSVVLWCLLMFSPYQAVIHQGSYAPVMVLFVLCCASLEAAGAWTILAVAALQTFTLATTWAGSNEIVHGPPIGWPFVLLGSVGLGLIVRRGFSEDEGRTLRQNRVVAAILAWWKNPRLTWTLLAGLALLLALRKPSALLTPQLWAEDGSVFLTQQDLIGAPALLQPYMGYLHMIPRLVAWTSAHLLDARWWPAFYNGTAFVIWIVVIARTFSPRLAVPGKPWLALAFFLGPQTGEVLFNVTNVQWVAAFVLIQQMLMVRPVTVAQRVGDLVLLALVSLTGPFALAFLPLFAWRCWREKNRDAVAVLLVAALCAGVQAWFVAHTGPKFEFEAAAFHLWPTLEIVARRLLIWPALGAGPALGMSKFAVGLVGWSVLGALVVWVLRPHPCRLLRAQVLAALALILAAGVYRIRPDTWAVDNLVYADRYFFIPRVLLGWLLIWEFDAAPRAVAWFARGLCFAIAAVHVGDYVVPAPIDYHWAQNCDPIRRGVPAKIPILPEGWTLEYEGRPHSR